MNKRRKINTTAVYTHYVDSETGELLEGSHVSVDHVYLTVKTDEQFYMVFASALKALKGLTALDECVLRWSCLKCGLKTNIICFNRIDKENCAAEFEVEVQSVSNSVSRLKKKGVLVGMGCGRYMINPQYFWKGTTNERPNAYDMYMEVVKEKSDKKEN
jgi:hypothetical protein